MNYLIYIIFGLAPSVIWLLFYLRKDIHPESNRMILKIFTYGLAATIPASLAEMGIFFTITKGGGNLSNWNFGSPLMFLLYGFLGVALVEEVIKYVIVREKVLKHPEFDEPVDVMLYMIIVALGFAALENIFYLLPADGQQPILLETIFTSLFRFIGATFLHSLCSATLGYFLALSFCRAKGKTRIIALGLGLATVLHGLFNFFIIKLGESLSLEKATGGLVITDQSSFVLSLTSLIALLAGLAVFVLWGFRRLKKLASVCKVR